MIQTPDKEERLDRINLMEFLEPNAPSEKVLYLATIQDAVSNYLYAFLGKNGTSADEFFASWMYLFKVKSTDGTTLKCNRTIKKIYTKKGQKIVENYILNDEEIRLMCFDSHYEMSGLSNYMDIDRFRSSLKDKRATIVKDNWEKITSYIDSLYQKELSQVANHQQLPLRIWSPAIERILVDPPSPQALASVIYVPSKLKRDNTTRANKAKLGKYHKLVAELQNLIPADEEWGPISDLLKRLNNDQAIGNNSSNSICSDSNRLSDSTSASHNR